MSNRGRILFINYHYIRDPEAYPYPGIHPLSPAAFRRQIEQLAEAYRFATPMDVEMLLDGVPPDEPLVMPTFDDGLVDNLAAIRDVLDPLGAKAAIFVCSRPLEDARALAVHKVHWLRATTPPAQFREELVQALPEPLDLDHVAPAVRERAAAMYIYDTPADGLLKFLINFVLSHDAVDAATSAMLAARDIDEAAFARDLYMDEKTLATLQANGHLIGAHGHTHQPFSRMERDALDVELVRSSACIERACGQRPTWVSYPYGRDWALPEDPEGLCKRHGFRLGITLLEGWNDGSVSPARLRRYNANEIDAGRHRSDTADAPAASLSNGRA